MPAPDQLRTASPDVRPAVPADVPALVELVESAYRGEASRAGWTTEADLLAGRRTDAAGVAAAVATGVLVATGADGELLACCALEARPAGVAHFGTFAVRPALQGRGTGAALLAHAERVAAGELRADVLEMTVIAQRPELIAWYERRGFERTGETRPFPYGDERFGVPLRDDLHFVVLAKPLARP